MTEADFRRLALALPGAIESAHLGHPDFRVGKRVFATLAYPEPGWAMVKLSLEQRELLVAAEPDIFSPVPGGWGRNGATRVRLNHADEPAMASALGMAWETLTSKKRSRPAPRPAAAARRQGSSGSAWVKG